MAKAQSTLALLGTAFSIAASAIGFINQLRGTKSWFR